MLQSASVFHDGRGLFHGPYQIKEGKTFRLDGGIFTALTPTRNQLAFQNRIEKIIIPEIDFEEASIHEVIEFFQDSITEQIGGENCGIQLALALDDFTKNPFSNSAEDSEPPLCTMSVKQITLLSAMDLIAELTAITYKVSENRILFSPKYTRPAQQF